MPGGAWFWEAELLLSDPGLHTHQGWEVGGQRPPQMQPGLVGAAGMNLGSALSLTQCMT